MRIHALAVAGVLALALAGCATTVTGAGAPAAAGGGGRDGGSGPGGRTPGPESAPTPGAEPTQTPTAPTEPPALDCPDDVVSPPGAPYCYTAPDGLSRIDLGSPTAGEEGSFRTSFGFGPADHIDVQAYVVRVDTDELTDEQIIGELAGVVADLESGGFDFPDQPRSLTVDGARGFAYDGTSLDGAQTITANFVFSGMNEVQLNCAATERTPLIDMACSDVLGSLQIVG